MSKKLLLTYERRPKRMVHKVVGSGAEPTQLAAARTRSTRPLISKRQLVDMSRPRAAPAAGTWSPSPSSSPPPSPSFLSDADRLRLLNEHAPLKPSSLPQAADGKSPLLFLSPEEVQEMVDQEDVEFEDEEDLPLWEELANAVVSLSCRLWRWS